MREKAVTQMLEQGLIHYRMREYGNALACFKDVIKNLKELDPGKQQILAKALQNTTIACFNKGKYRKAIKSGKLALRVLHSLARTTPEAEAELAPTQQKLLLALEAYLRFTVSQHHRLLIAELNHGQEPKANLLQLCRDGLSLVTKPLAAFDNDARIKMTPLCQSLQDTLKQLLEWLQTEAVRTHQNNQPLEALNFCQIATGPLREALPSLGAAPEQETLATLAAIQKELEARLNRDAARDLEIAQDASLKTPPDFEAARKHFKFAAQKYHHLCNPEKMLEAVQALKTTLRLQEKQSGSFDTHLRHARFLSENLTGGRKKTRGILLENEAEAGSTAKKQLK